MNAQELKPVSNSDFMDLMFQGLPEGARPLVCAFPGDPNQQGGGAWWAVPYMGTPNHKMAADLNTYCAVSSFYKGFHDKSGEMRYLRRKDQFAALHCVMIDDLGDGLGSKHGMDILMRLPPTALVETSPRNFQAWIRLREPVSDRDTAERLIKAMIAQGLMADTDPGMAGVTRVGRLPVGVNGKPKYGGWTVRMSRWNPDVSYTLNEVVEALGLDLSAVSAESSRHAGFDIEPSEDPYLNVLGDMGLVSSGLIPHNGGHKVELVCPWVDEHTDRADSGTVYFVGGGFKCHHGHCVDRRMPELKRWLADQGVDVRTMDAQQGFRGDPEDFQGDLPPIKPSLFKGRRAAPGYDLMFGESDETPFKFIIDNLLPASSFGVVGAGGALKTTTVLIMMIHTILGKPFAGREILHPGPCVLVTAEDEMKIVAHRVRKMCLSMGLSMREKELIAENLHIEDVSVDLCRLVAQDRNNDLELTVNVDLFKSHYKDIRPSIVVFDPAVYFGAGERFVNDNEGLLMMAARNISTALGSATGYIHHTGKSAARDGIVDQYVGRGGSAFADNSRALFVMVPGEDSKNPPPEDVKTRLLYGDTLSRIHVEKQSYCARDTVPLYAVRNALNPWDIEFYWGEKRDRKNIQRDADEAAARERKLLIAAIYKLVGAMTGVGLYPTKTQLKVWPIYIDEKKVGKDKITPAVEAAAQLRHLAIQDLPEHLRHGAGQHYFSQGHDPEVPEDYEDAVRYDSPEKEVA